MHGRQTAVFLVVFCIGLITGACFFSRSRAGSGLDMPHCGLHCTSANELAGMLTAAGIRHTPALLPKVVQESTHCVAINHPRPQGKVHFVLFPKRDVRNILEVVSEDQPYVFGCFALARALLAQTGIRNYRLHTNGPALQHITYLHFHLIAQ